MWHTPDDLADKISEKNLVRDTRIYVHAVWRLLTDAVLSLDYAVYVQDLLAELGKLRDGLDGRFSLDSLVAGAMALRDSAKRLAACAAAADDDQAARVNRTLMLMSRALVPLDYTSGDRFAHDPALPHGRHCSRCATLRLLPRIRMLANSWRSAQCGHATASCTRCDRRLRRQTCSGREIAASPRSSQ